MRNLLSANFLRLRKSALFWSSLALMAGHALWQIRYHTAFAQVTIDMMIFDYAVSVSIVSAVWSSLFLGTDHSDGTLRNKLVAGHPRTAIYFANLITNTAVALLQCAAYLAVTFGLGSFLIGPTRMEPGRLLSLFAGTIATTAALCAIFTAVGMLCARRTAAAILCVAGSFALFGYMSSVDSYLNVPEYAVSIEFHENREPDITYQLNDVGYVSGARRAVFEFLDDVVPSGQAVQYMRHLRRETPSSFVELLTAEQLEEYERHMRPEVDPLPLIAYSLALTAAVTAAGIALFRRKDLK
ncbi:MAG: ABC transporter permease [Oscillospiraceae bacterium]|nr:ABC transporter permease [Oscillospiraceae bacterium]